MIKLQRLPAPAPALNRLALILPPFLAALFTLGLGLFLGVTVYQERANRTNAMEQDLLWQKQAIQLQMAHTQHELKSLADTLAVNGLESADFTARTLSLFQNTPELVSLSYVDDHRTQRWRHPISPRNDEADFMHRNLVALRSAVAARDEALYSVPITDLPGESLMALAVPVQFASGTRHFLVAQFDLNRLLQQQVPWWIAQRYQIALLRADGSVLAHKFERNLDPDKLNYQLPLEIGPEALTLSATHYRERDSWQQNAVLAALIGLSMLMLLSTWALRNHIRERQAAEARLRRETAMRMAMEDSMLTGIRVMDLRGRLSYVNRAFCQMTGYSESELLEAGMQMPYWREEDQGRYLAANQSILRGVIDPNGYQCRFRHRDGREFDVRIYASRLIDGEGQHIGWISSIHDITELQREREALQASHERFVTVLNGLDAAVTVTDAVSGALLLCNRQYLRAFKLPADYQLCCIVPFAPRLRAEASEAEWYDQHGQRWYQIKSRPSIWVDGSMVWLEIASDITAIKSAQQREHQQNEQLQQTSRLISMGEMASSLAHELNQPLAAIASYATGCRNLLQQDNPELHQLDFAIEKMAEQAKRAGLIIRGIREFVQRGTPHQGSHSFVQLLETVQALLGAQLRNSQTQLHYELPDYLPPVFADRVMLEQVLFNLLKNAIEAMSTTPARRREIRVSAQTEDDMLHVTIADRGTGIPPEQLEQLFKAFYSTKETGMGMGLNICRSIIEHHKGRLWVEANPGGGCRFHFTVPLSEDSHANQS